jgi:hypothetical protein
MSDLSDSDSSLREDEVVFTVQEVLRTGLSILHYTKKKIRRAKRATNLDRFKGHYGVLPVVVCELTVISLIPTKQRRVAQRKMKQ